MSTGGKWRAGLPGWRKRAPSREALPLLLLLLALSAVFVFGNDRGHFYRPGHHNKISGQTLSLAANLSAGHRFAMYRSQWLDGDGESAYEYYNRFPIGPYLLVKMAILPFGDDFPRAVHASRLLMLACFAAAAVLACLALARLIGDRWIALTATLLAFSSYYCLYYNDMISADGSTSLLGVMLTFHGMTVFVQEGRFRQLLLKTAIAILLGWHVLALAAPFVALGLASELVRARRGGDRLTQIAAAAARSRYVAYSAFSVLCCALLLGWNLGSEYLALGGEVPVTELPSLRSLLRRSGVSASARLFEDSSAYTDWAPFLRGQLTRIGVTASPFAAPQFFNPDVVRWPLDSQIAAAFAAVGAAAFGASMAGLTFLRQRMLPATLLLAGWCWALPVRASTGIHDFEAMFYIGVPLVLFLPALLGLQRLPGRTVAIPGIAAAALLAFVLSAALIGRVGNEGDAAEAHRDLTADFSAIRKTTTGGSLVANSSRIDRQVHHPEVFWMLRYYLTGTFLQNYRFGTGQEWDTVTAYDYIVLPLNIGGSLTPQNRRTFLYRISELPGLYDARAARDPAIRGAFNVHLEGRTLTYARSGCSEEDTAAGFFLHVVPATPGDLPAERRRFGFDNLDFGFRERGARFAGRCVALAELPAYDIAFVRTGQFAGGDRLWEGRFRVGAPDRDDRYAAITAGEPSLRGAFDVYLDGRTLHYLRGECRAEDTAPRFFLHVVPIDAADLPEERRRAGFDNLDFAFADRGLRFGERCLASIRLPTYGVARVRTGQHAGGERLWEGEFAFPPGE